MSSWTYKSGDWNVICDVCGQKSKASLVKKRWDGLIVCPDDYEERHIQDFLRVSPDKITVSFTRNPEDTFVDQVCTISGKHPYADYATADCAIVGFNIYTPDGLDDGFSVPTDSTVFPSVPSGPTYIEFTVQPSETIVDEVISPSVEVTVTDSNSVVSSDYSGDVVIAFSDNPNGGTLGGTLTVQANSGVAVFDDLTVDVDGGRYSLVATSGSITSEISNTFTVGVGSTPQSVDVDRWYNELGDGSLFGFQDVANPGGTEAFGSVNPTSVNGATILGIIVEDPTGDTTITLSGVHTQGFFTSVQNPNAFLTLNTASATFSIVGSASRWTWSSGGLFPVLETGLVSLIFS